MTHTLVGLGVANAFFRRRVGPEAVPILALASNLPDIDALVHLTGDPTAILMRRTFGHSLILLPFSALALALLLHRFYPHHRIRTLFGLTMLGAGLHLFFDLVNSFGVVLLWPLSDWRPELATVFIIDLTLTGLLAVPLLLSISRRIRPHLVMLSRVAVAGVAAYVLFCGASRMLAERALTAESERLGLRPDFSYVFPEPLGPHRWKGVTRGGEIYRVYRIFPLEGRLEFVESVRTELSSPSVERARKMPLARKIEWFFRAPVWNLTRSRAQEPPGGEEVDLTVYDLRFRSIVIDRMIPFMYRLRLYKDKRLDLYRDNQI